MPTCLLIVDCTASIGKPLRMIQLCNGRNCFLFTFVCLLHNHIFFIHFSKSKSTKWNTLSSLLLSHSTITKIIKLFYRDFPHWQTNDPENGSRTKNRFDSKFLLLEFGLGHRRLRLFDYVYSLKKIRYDRCTDTNKHIHKIEMTTKLKYKNICIKSTLRRDVLIQTEKFYFHRRAKGIFTKQKCVACSPTI